mmetsp:Transcript_8545/g.19864  ORF Transcript_8545/g.19864 Transcript_8545/m.19864 type:complete len:99 (+) Transcript_8545:682-978(+)
MHLLSRSLVSGNRGQEHTLARRAAANEDADRGAQQRQDRKNDPLKLALSGGVGSAACSSGASTEMLRGKCARSAVEAQAPLCLICVLEGGGGPLEEVE